MDNDELEKESNKIIKGAVKFQMIVTVIGMTLTAVGITAQFLIEGLEVIGGWMTYIGVVMLVIRVVLPLFIKELKEIKKEIKKI